MDARVAGIYHDYIAKAEACLARSPRSGFRHTMAPEWQAIHAAEAQVYATLALAVATAGAA